MIEEWIIISPNHQASFSLVEEIKGFIDKLCFITSVELITTDNPSLICLIQLQLSDKIIFIANQSCIDSFDIKCWNHSIILYVIADSFTKIETTN